MAAAAGTTTFSAAPAQASVHGVAAPAAAPAAPAAPPSPGTATAVAGKVDLDLQLLTGLLGALHLGGPAGLDVPLANLSLGTASAPNANGDSANFTNSVLRLRDDLISTLHLPGPEADLLKADAVSGTARVIRGPGGYTQAYATVANLRLFLPLLNLPGASADNGILKIDAVSAQATCVPGQKPSVSAKLPTTILLLGRQIPVPLSGDIPLDIGVAKLDVHLSPVTTTDTQGASSAVEARITVDAVGLAKVSGAIVLASAACTMPGAAAVGSGANPATGGAAGTPGTSTTGTSTTGTTAVAAAGSANGGTGTTGTTGTATATTSAPPTGAAGGNADHDLAATGASGSLLPIAGTAAVLVLGGAGLLVFLKRRTAGAAPPEDPGAE
ncbi:hypothetical protein GCM10009839_15370 [Catenulispora yoronensis]|uniref:LPXTG cell wall anchor domain-containing protein n=1 Tax=Catenulispora yoronensis TaxID=450799 RepID=A0ABN2TTV7_9ACTN